VLDRTLGSPVSVEITTLGHLDQDPRSPAVARRLVRALLHAVTDDEAVQAVVLAVSELATNAVEHAGTPFELRGGTDGDRVRVEVIDGSLTLPNCATPDARSPSGRGLLLVERVADAWGVDLLAAGKRVWFERRIGVGGHTPP
jgi:anti-sigma regulatory factor (Ser/Thr protein kinase)